MENTNPELEKITASLFEEYKGLAAKWGIEYDMLSSQPNPPFDFGWIAFLHASADEFLTPEQARLLRDNLPQPLKYE